MKQQSFLALFGSGFTTGVSVDLGEETTEINPIYEGGSINYANMNTNIAGVEIKRSIQDSLEKRGLDLGNDPESVVSDIWKLLYISNNSAVTKDQYKTEFVLPNGQVVDVSEEIYMAGEMYFQPQMMLGDNSDKLSIQEALVTAILKVDEGLQSEMYDAIVTHGGLLTMPGFNKRLSREIEEIIHRPVHIIGSSEPYAVTWMGGAVFAGMSEAPRLWVLKKQYEEYGEKVVRTKFI